MKIGVKKNSIITAVDYTAIQRGGAYSGYGLIQFLIPADYSSECMICRPLDIKV